MGRTIPSYRMILEEEIRGWKRFSDFLRRDDKAYFEAMMDACRLYASYAGAALRPIPTEAMLMSILFHHQKLISDLQAKIESLQKEINAQRSQAHNKAESLPSIG